jgi:ribonuclease HI
MSKRVRVVSTWYRLFFDGASKGNPGHAAGGWCLLDHEDRTVANGWHYIGSHCTNNEAEYNGLIDGLLYIHHHLTVCRTPTLYIHGDSQLVINQLTGVWQCRKPELKALHKKVCDLVNHSELTVVFEYIPRLENKEADALANMGVRSRNRMWKTIETDETVLLSRPATPEPVIL